jgi:GAF domain-containing protein
LGAKCARYFTDAERLGGLAAKIRLASWARITSTEAAAGPDSPDIIERLTLALERVKLEFSTQPQFSERPTAGSHPPSVAPGLTNVVTKLRAQIASMLDLMSQRSLILEDPRETARRVDEAAATALNVARVSTWLLDDTLLRIICLDLFDGVSRTHQSGVEISASGHERYFEALATERSILANDARSDPRTSCFAESYLVPLGIGAMLDVPIWVRGRMVGVVCHEHIGGPRQWDRDDERYAYLMSSLISLSIERQKPSSPSD